MFLACIVYLLDCLLLFVASLIFGLICLLFGGGIGVVVFLWEFAVVLDSCLMHVLTWSTYVVIVFICYRRCDFSVECLLCVVYCLILVVSLSLFFCVFDCGLLYVFVLFAGLFPVCWFVSWLFVGFALLVGWFALLFDVDLCFACLRLFVFVYRYVVYLIALGVVKFVDCCLLFL